jgi:hypothetical protein
MKIPCLLLALAAAGAPMAADAGTVILQQPTASYSQPFTGDYSIAKAIDSDTNLTATQFTANDSQNSC